MPELEPPGLIRWLPHAWARPLGRTAGRLAALSAARRRPAEESLRRALPHLDPAGRRQLLRAAFRDGSAAIFELASARRFDARRLCRRLTLEGWEHLDTADGAGPGGAVLASVSAGIGPLAALAAALYRGPVDTCGPTALRSWLEAWEARLGQPLLGAHHGPEDAVSALARGTRVAVSVDAASIGGTGVEASWLGRSLRVDATAAHLAVATGAPVVPLLAVPEPAGGFSVVARPPLDPRPGEDTDGLTGRLLRAITGGILERPESWPWWRQGDIGHERPGALV